LQTQIDNLNRRLKILIIYKSVEYPLRKTIEEHLYSFKRYTDAECYYIKLDTGFQYLRQTNKPIPTYLTKIDFDIIIFHYGFLATRFVDKNYMDIAVNQAMPFMNSKAIKVIIPQDEWLHTNALNDFINRFNIDVIFTVAPKTEWKKIYDQINHDKVKFYPVLTGYVDDHAIKKIETFVRTIKKTIDIGYRASNQPQWMGRHGYLKSQIAGIFRNASKKYNLKTDISIDPKDIFLKEKWYKFLARCKYMIGVEGGATVLDKSGEIWKKGSAYVKERPNASFEEIEEACFPGLDGQLQLIAISPRHLECCMSRTCQVLVEGTYNGILKPNIHYLEVKADFSNLDNVLNIIKEDSIREEITDNAYRDIILSEKYSYRSFSNFVIEKSIQHLNGTYLYRNTKNNLPLLYYNHVLDWFLWKMTSYEFYKAQLVYWAALGLKFLGLKEPVKKVYLCMKKIFFYSSFNITIKN